MGQTLTHGIYLPDEGERNCYDGLASNWSILDGAVGTVAEHTSALAGKAPLVHTHTVSQITDFPAYGNAAGTICEGNDSRLSDARTPVAHTHTKSDVTDLFNSANTWSAQQKIIGNNSRGIVSIYNPAYTKGNTLSSTDLSIGSIYMGDGGQQGLANSLTFISTDLAANGAKTLLSLSAMENTASSGTRTNVVIQYDKNDAENPKKVSVGGALIPNPDATFPLGTPSFRWKTLNGVNPGALSLPKGYTEEGADKDYINIASVIQTLDGTAYSYTLPDNGWICVRAEQAKQVHVTLYSWYFGQSISHPTGSTLIVSVPFRKNDQITLKVNAVTLQYARFYPMQGNV